MEEAQVEFTPVKLNSSYATDMPRDHVRVTGNRPINQPTWYVRHSKDSQTRTTCMPQICHKSRSLKTIKGKRVHNAKAMFAFRACRLTFLKTMRGGPHHVVQEVLSENALLWS